MPLPRDQPASARQRSTPTNKNSVADLKVGIYRSLTICCCRTFCCYPVYCSAKRSSRCDRCSGVRRFVSSSAALAARAAERIRRCCRNWLDVERRRRNSRSWCTRSSSKSHRIRNSSIRRSCCSSRRNFRSYHNRLSYPSCHRGTNHHPNCRHRPSCLRLRPSCRPCRQNCRSYRHHLGGTSRHAWPSFLRTTSRPPRRSTGILIASSFFQLPIFEKRTNRRIRKIAALDAQDQHRERQATFSFLGPTELMAEFR